MMGTGPPPRTVPGRGTVLGGGPVPGKMTHRERILAVYRGETPDVVPYMLDLSHWFYHKNRLPWDLTTVYEKPETALIDYHKRAGVGFYMPNLASFYSAEYGADVRSSVSRGERNGAPEITWRLETPLGAIERRRVWEDASYSWAISSWGIQDEKGLRILARRSGREPTRRAGTITGPGMIMSARRVSSIS